MGGGYIKNRHSLRAETAYKKGLLPLSRITKKNLDDAGWEHSMAFFGYLCKEQYIVPTEWHHTTFVYRNTKFYNVVERVKYAKKYLDLESLKHIYLNKSSKQDILKNKGVQYVTVLFSRKLMKSKSDRAIDCIKYNGFYWWGSTICINENSDKIMFIKHYQPEEINLWYNKNKKKIEQQIIIRNDYKVKPQK